MDKLVEEICEAIAPGIFYGFDGCTEAQAQWSWPGHTDKDRALIREIAADALAIAQKRVNELEAALSDARNNILSLLGGFRDDMPDVAVKLFQAQARQIDAALPTPEVPGESEEEMR